MAKEKPKLIPFKQKHRRRYSVDIFGQTNVTTTFRPHLDLLEDYAGIIEWTEANKSNFSAIVNSFLPAILYTLRNRVFIDEATGRRYLRAEFGDVLLRETHLPNT